jgi:hypothetical protein
MATRIATHWAAEFAAAMKINARVQLFFFNFKLYRLDIITALKTKSYPEQFFLRDSHMDLLHWVRAESRMPRPSAWG